MNFGFSVLKNSFKDKRNENLVELKQEIEKSVSYLNQFPSIERLILGIEPLEENSGEGSDVDYSSINPIFSSSLDSRYIHFLTRKEEKFYIENKPFESYSLVRVHPITGRNLDNIFFEYVSRTKRSPFQVLKGLNTKVSLYNLKTMAEIFDLNNVTSNEFKKMFCDGLNIDREEVVIHKNGDVQGSIYELIMNKD
ncbi:MAG: hypothetical protein ACMXX6_00380 [Candidatus Woesearchaeota archaeon]